MSYKNVRDSLPIQQSSILSEDDIYITLSVTNRTNNEIECRYDETRAVPLIQGDSSKYKVALFNVSIPTEDVPLFNFVEYNGSNPIESYSITLVLNDNTLVAPIISQQYLQTVPYAIGNKIYLYSQYLISTNNAFTAAFNDIVAQYNVLFGPGAYQLVATYPQVAPMLVQDVVEQIFYLKIPIEANADFRNPNASIDPTTSTQANQIVMQVFANVSWDAKIYNIPSRYVGLPTFNRDTLYRFYYTGDSRTLITDPIDSNQYLCAYQQQPSSSLMSDVQGLLIFSNSIPVDPYYVNVPLPGAINVAPQSSTIMAKIIGGFIPFQISIESNTSENQFIYIVDELKFQNISGQLPLYKLAYDIQIVRSNGSLEPLFIGDRRFASITLVFRKK